MGFRTSRLAFALVFAFALRAEAAVSVTLTDGQILKGSGLKRDGDSFLVVMDAGGTVAVPAALVKAISFSDDAKKAPPGFDFSGPKTLAGPATRPSQDAKDQLKAFGPPTQWSKDVIDTTWTPTSAFDLSKDVFAFSRTTWAPNVVDTTWQPKDAFDTSQDLFASTRATWSASVVDTTWTPADGWGFKPLWTKAESAAPSRPPADVAVALSLPVPAAPELSPWSCGESLLAKDLPAGPADGGRAASISVRPVRDERLMALGLPLYEAVGTVGSEARKAVFTLAGGSCRLVGGDADALLGLNLTPELTTAQDAAAFNAVTARRGGAVVPAGVDKLDYALAFVALTDPRVSGTRAAELKLIAKPEDLTAIAGATDSSCSLSRGKRRKEARTASGAFATPRIRAGQDGDVITFLTWSSAGGVLSRETVVLTGGGVVTAKRETIASHLGVHVD
jgi:hypothetical protein